MFLLSFKPILIFHFSAIRLSLACTGARRLSKGRFNKKESIGIENSDNEEIDKQCFIQYLPLFCVAT